MQMTAQCTPLAEDVRTFVETTAWTFAKTYAATWPHEYVVQHAQNASMVLALARHIFKHGVDGRFYQEMAAGRVEFIKCSFLFWVGQVLAITGS